MITVKRNCSSSVRFSKNKVTFGDFTIVIDGEEWERFKEVAKMYIPDYVLPACEDFRKLLEEIIDCGINERKEILAVRATKYRTEVKE